MRYILKNNEPQAFSDWKASANDEWQPTYKNLPGDIKKVVYESLLNEQGHICCYCERELTENDYHIEHLNPQFLKEGDDLNYGNFICSCLNRTKKGTPLHCGQLKGKNIISINPLQEDCQSKFTYTAAGEINGEDHDANDTIEILGLNIKKLISMRKDAISPFLSGELDDDELKEFVLGYITCTPNGKRNAFCSMIEYIFQDIVGL